MSRSEKFLDEALNCKQSGFCDLQRLCVQTDKNCCERKQPSDLQCDLGVDFRYRFAFRFTVIFSLSLPSCETGMTCLLWLFNFLPYMAANSLLI